MKRVAIVAGGTGGHVIPAITMAHMVKKIGHSPIILTDHKSYNKYFNKSDFTVYPILPARKRVFDLFMSCIRALYFYIFSDIDISICFGSYHSLPAAISSRIVMTSIYLYEPNIIIGDANKFIMRYCNPKSLWIANPYVMGIKNVSKIRYTGFLMREEFLRLQSNVIKNDCLSDKKVILITAGSNGSGVFDHALHEMCVFLQNSIMKKIFVIQQVKDEKTAENIEYFYRTHGINCIIAPFFKNIAYYFAIADIVISRAGAGAISEILVNKKPSIVIPIANSVNNHQMYNAKYMHDQGAILCVTEDEIKTLSVITMDILFNQSTRNIMIDKAAKSCKIFGINDLNNEIGKK